MASPQLEDGYTEIANEILEVLMRVYLPPNQWQVLLCILRKTYGYKKKVDWIANSQIAEATGLARSTVSRALSSLQKQCFIMRHKKSVGFQKDWEKWEISSPANSEAKISNPANNQKLAAQSTEIDSAATKKLTALLPTKEKKNKLIQKKIYGEFQNVLLTDEEYQWLKDKLQNRINEYIERLSGYLASIGKDKYKSHYATILNWHRRDNGKAKGRGLPGRDQYTEILYEDD